MPLRLIAWVVALSPVWFLACLIACYGVNVIRNDEWDFFRYAVVWKGGPAIHWADFFRQFNDCRPATPRLIFFILARFTDWNIRAEMFFVLGMLCANVWMFSWLFRHGKSGQLNGRRLSPTAVFLAALIIFSPWQAELLWGFQIVIQMPTTFILAGMVIIRSGFPFAAQMLLVLLACLGSSFCSINGLLAWPLLGAFALLHYPRAFIRHWWILLLAVIVFVVLLKIYLAGALLGLHVFDRLVQWTTTRIIWWDREFIPAFLGFLGAPLGSFHGDTSSYILAAIFGGVAVITMLGTLGIVLHRRLWDIVFDMLPFLVICAFELCNALLATAGRLSMGAAMLWSSTRYGAFSTYFLASVFFLCLMTWQSRERLALSIPAPPPRSATPERAAQFARRLTFIYAALLGCLLASECFAYVQSFFRVQDNSLVLQQNRSALMFADKVIMPETATVLFFQNAPGLRQHVVEAHKYHMLGPEAPSNLFASTDFSPAATGSVDVLTIERGNIYAGGWAYLTRSKGPPDCVVFTSQVNGQPEPFAIAFPRINRPDVSLALKIQPSLTGWEFTAPIPEGATDIRAWAVDGDVPAAYPLHMPANQRN